MPKWDGHPFNKPNGDKMPAANVRNLVRVLRSFSSGLHDEGFRPRERHCPAEGAQTDPDTAGGCRNAAMLLLFPDTGLRLPELLRLFPGDTHLDDRWLRVMGKGQKGGWTAYPFFYRPLLLLGNVCTEAVGEAIYEVLHRCEEDGFGEKSHAFTRCSRK